MNAFAADDLEAADIETADLLALARRDDGGAPSPGSVARSQPAGLNLDNDRDCAACRGSAAAAADPA
jgi:hypothetical protein